MYSLADPWVLLLLPIPVLAMWFLGPRSAQMTSMIVPQTIGRGILQQSAGRGFGAKAGQVLPWLVWALVIIALTGPQKLTTNEALPMSGRDLVMVLDLSGSMVRDDFELEGQSITRLDAVKHVGAEFIRGRGGDRIGLVVFGSKAYEASPMTHDVEAVATSLERLTIGISGRATNIGDGLGVALKRLENTDARSRVVVLLSDGKNNAGAAAPRGVAKLARSMDVRVHTIAMGPLSLADAPDERGVVDVATLQAIADLSGGTSFRVRTMDDLLVVGQAIDALEAMDTAGLAAELHQPLWIFPAVLALIGCLALAGRAQP